ncbi:hypothetical protein PanWU01x14_167260 [Parasponia andersonii]|uniref:Uncharacterized protein n=1 Tax=Parasponia andersonii TaxID=3476 RepID=A0A2P5CBH1_PARAD|nr:hypothetical protein PanWU01x14_167260 [Parasponia andersonii]
MDSIRASSPTRLPSTYVLLFGQMILGKTNYAIFRVRIHLGRPYLKRWDLALCYDLYAANNNDMELEKYKGPVLPDAIFDKEENPDMRFSLSLYRDTEIRLEEKLADVYISEAEDGDSNDHMMRE